YNPKQHPYFDQEGGRFIYFEGTYSHTFSGNEHPTPRYDYNQIMYRLDLADERLRPVAGAHLPVHPCRPPFCGPKCRCSPASDPTYFDYVSELSTYALVRRSAYLPLGCCDSRISRRRRR